MWIGAIALAVFVAPENEDLWKDQVQKREAAISALRTHREIHVYCRRPGAQKRHDKALEKGRHTWEYQGDQFKLSFPKGVSKEQVADALKLEAANFI